MKDYEVLGPLNEVDLSTNMGGQRIRAVVHGALKSCINDHGPITSEFLASATKRVLGGIKTFNRQQRAIRQRDGNSVEGRIDALEAEVKELREKYRPYEELQKEVRALERRVAFLESLNEGRDERE